MKSVVNEGIFGNTVTRTDSPGIGQPAIERLDRDVLDRAGVTHVILFEGTNDIRRNVTAAQLIAGLQEIIDRVKVRGLKIIGATLIPRHEGSWTAEMSQVRHEVNTWIRNQAAFDAVIDFDEVMRDPNNPDLINPLYDVGDHIHPNDMGYIIMGRSIDLTIFQNMPSDVGRTAGRTARWPLPAHEGWQ